MYNAAVWLAKVEGSTGKAIEVDWQPFSLAQINCKEGPDFKFWEQPGALDGTDKTLLAHRAGLAARRQGEAAFRSFFMTLLRARHEDRKSLTDSAVMEEAAAESGLDPARFREDLADPGLLREVGESHDRAVTEYGAFGVPTFVFPGGKSAYLKMFIPPDDQVVNTYDALFKLMGDFAHVGEVKRPQPPWPSGVI